MEGKEDGDIKGINQGERTGQAVVQLLGGVRVTVTGRTSSNHLVVALSDLTSIANSSLAKVESPDMRKRDLMDLRALPFRRSSTQEGPAQANAVHANAVQAHFRRRFAFQRALDALDSAWSAPLEELVAAKPGAAVPSPVRSTRLVSLWD